jgi:putative two-component system response regulator
MQNEVADSAVMIIDDGAANLKILSSLMKSCGYQVQTFLRGRTAIEAALLNPPDLFLLDVSMPEMDGFEVCVRFKAEPALQDIPVVFLSALTSPEDKVKAFTLGGVDYVTKPFNIEEVKSRVATHLSMSKMRAQLQQHNRNLGQLVAEKVKEINDAQIGTIYALAKLAENRDNETGKHVDRVQSYTKVLAESMRECPQYKDRINEEYVMDLFYTTPLHDIGKVAIPDRILLKPGPLDPQEFEIMKTHTVLGVKTLDTIHKKYPNNTLLTMGVAVTRSHHEKWDGSGYPDGLSGEAIPLAGRIMAIADVYDALRSQRVYKEQFSHEKACRIMIEGRGSHFDPGIVDVFQSVAPDFNDISIHLNDAENEEVDS